MVVAYEEEVFEDKKPLRMNINLPKQNFNSSTFNNGTKKFDIKTPMPNMAKSKSQNRKNNFFTKTPN